MSCFFCRGPQQYHGVCWCWYEAVRTWKARESHAGVRVKLKRPRLRHRLCWGPQSMGDSCLGLNQGRARHNIKNSNCFFYQPDINQESVNIIGVK
ncbi:hypothetical protein TcasGA2_TC034479 [Tribolium castaneum]|uniref:Uncharacterized protein n=1 Tax=Tribolium castaneum TaxID=7070 RepID=A0A139WBW2_TRICA|nr:hypothetical protein TcasGA2_TC034479 [Tribolium castaneum]